MRSLFLLLSAVLLALPSFAAAEATEGDVRHVVTQLKKKDPGISKFFDKAVAYVVFPSVGKGGFIVGGAHGNGLVYEGGKRVGHAELVQATVGLQFGGQEFAEFVFFENREAFAEFKKGKFSVAAQVSAVAAAEGAAEKAKYELGVAVFVLPKSGLMVEASVGGQRLEFEADGK